MSTAIEVENLGKKYIISHQHQGGYISLREELTEAVKKIGKRVLSPQKNIPMDKEEFWALKDVGFTVKQGERLGIIGGNGAGKSTLLKILSRITPPTEGKVRLRGKVASLLEVGTGFHPELTGRENVFLNGAVLGMKKADIKKKFDQIVAFAGVEKFLDTPVKRYSSGMYVRLAFAVAAHLEPEVLIIDEVLAVGDVAFQKKCLGRMEEVGKEGRTVIFVSHNMSAVSSLCTKGVYLKDGKSLLWGSMGECVQEYLSGFANNESARANIEHRKPRYGPAAFSRLLSIETMNIDSQVCGQFKIGSAMKVKLTFRLTKDVQTLEIGFGIISLATGVNLQAFIGYWEGLKTDFNKGNYSVICEIPSINVFPGKYSITAWLKKQGEGVDDQVPMSIQFEVIGSDITGCSAHLEQYPNSGVFQRSNWVVE